MNCQILRTLYVKANGTVPCEDDAGEWVDLGKVESESAWTIENIFQGNVYKHLRSSFARQMLPWPEVCSKCALIRSYERPNDLISKKRIEKLQIEASLACTLRCPCCSNLGQMKLRHKPYIMPLSLFRRLLESLAAEQYSIGTIEYCGQGEPLAHPQFADFVRIAREIHPAARQRLVTNANYDYAKKVEGEFIDEIYVSCDGFYQESYEKYRQGGSVAKVLKFMHDAGSISQSKRPLVVWKYILFEHNDSPEEISAAHDYSLQSNVGMLMFVLTLTDFRSKVYTPANYDDILLLAPNARLFKTPGFLREPGQASPREFKRLSLARETGGDGIKSHIDRIVLSAGIITVQGWAVSVNIDDEITSVDINVYNIRVGSAKLGVLREDVYREIPLANTRHGGFVLAAKWKLNLPRRLHLRITTKKGLVVDSDWHVSVQPEYSRAA